jgi:multidrug efflux pump subunit AcrA (membrane-fusion protein)
MSNEKDKRDEHNSEQENATLSQWHGDALDSTAKLPLHKDTRDEEQKREEEEAHKRKMHRVVVWVVVGVVVLFLLIFLLGYLPRHKRDEATKKQADAQRDSVPVVQVMQVKNTPPSNDLSVPGTTTPLTQANVYGRANGYLKARYVDIGDHVHQGQLLAVIDAPDLDQQVDQGRASLRQAQSQLEQQQSQLDLAQVTWNRWKVLVAKGVFSRQDGDQRQTDFNAQVANVAAAQRNVQSFEANLGRLIALQRFERVVSPFDGVITARNVDVGALISATGSGGGDTSLSPTNVGSPTQSGSTNTSGTTGNAATLASPSTGGAQGGALFSIADVSKLRIYVSVPESYAPSIRVGQQTSLYFQSLPKQNFFGKVTRTAGSVDPNSRTLLTEIQVDNREGLLFSGMYVVATFLDVHGDAGVTIPGDAVVIRGDKEQVALVRDGKIHLQPIEVGRDFGPTVQVLRGLAPGDVLVTTVTDEVKEGVKVEAREAKTPGTSGSPTSGQHSTESPGGAAQYGDQKQVDQGSKSTQQQKGSGDSQKNGGKK